MHYILWQSFNPLVLLWFIFRKYDFFFLKFCIKYLCIFLCKPMLLCCLLTISFHGWTANEHKLKLHLQKCVFFFFSKTFCVEYVCILNLAELEFPKKNISASTIFNVYQTIWIKTDENIRRVVESLNKNPLPLCFSQEGSLFFPATVENPFFPTFGSENIPFFTYGH